MQRDLMQMQSEALPDNMYLERTSPLPSCAKNSSQHAYEVLKSHIERKGLVVLSTPSLRLGNLVYLAFKRRPSRLKTIDAKK